MARLPLEPTISELSHPLRSVETVALHRSARTSPPSPHPITPSATFLQHTLCALVARGSMLAARGVALILLSRHLGVVQFGVYALLLATFNVVVIPSAFGVEQANLYLAGRRPRRVAALVGNSLLLGGGLGAVGGGLLLITVELLRSHIFSDASHGAVWLCAFAIPLAVLHNSLTGIVIGLARFRYYSVVESVKWTVYLGLVCFLSTRDSFDVLVALFCFFVVLALGASAHLLRLMLIARRLPCFDWRLMWSTLALGRRMLLAQSSHALCLRLDVYAARFLGSKTLVGHYALAANLGEILLYLARSMALVVFSGTARGSRTSRVRMQNLTRWVLCAATLLCAVLLVTKQGLLRLLFGETAEGCMGTLVLRLPGVVASAVTLLLCGDLLGRGRADLVVRGNLLAITVLGLLVWPLMAWNAPLGAALAFTMAAIVQLIWISSRRRRIEGVEGLKLESSPALRAE